MAKFETLKKCIEQLEKCEYQTADGFHELKMNTAFIQIKQHIETNYMADKMIQTLLDNGYKYAEMPKIFQKARLIHEQLNAKNDDKN